MKKNVKIIRYDNAGGKKIVKENCAKNFEESKFDFTSPGTPHQNGVVERVFDKHYYHTRVIIMHTILHNNLKTGPWTECVANTNELEISTVNLHEEDAHMRSLTEKFQTTQNT